MDCSIKPQSASRNGRLEDEVQPNARGSGPVRGRFAFMLRRLAASYGFFGASSTNVPSIV
jgi:hypothetical protein